MPPLLKYDAVRLIEASLECLHIAVVSLGSSKRIGFRQASAMNAAEVGLIGAAAELAMSACLIQAYGPGAIVWPSGRYKAGSQILDEFRSLVREATPSSSFLTQGVSNAIVHRSALLESTQPFRQLVAIRAGGFHAGRGLLHEASVFLAQAVATFLELLSASSRMHAYLGQIPVSHAHAVDRLLLLEDLANRLQADNLPDQASALASLYVVLPDIPDELPDWVEALDRVTVSPRQRDIEYLLQVLEHAVPAVLRRVGPGPDRVPVVVRPDDPAALPIAPQFLRRQFNQIPDQYHADVGLANGRLEAGTLDVPPVEAIRDIFALGLERTGIVGAGEMLNAHQSWPGIVSSLACAGTPGPYWFLARRTDDLGQLQAQLRRVNPHVRPHVSIRLHECNHGIAAIREQTNLPTNDATFGPLVGEIEVANTNRERLGEAARRNQNTRRALPANLADAVAPIANGEIPVGVLLANLLQAEPSPACLTYWPRILAEAANEADDLASLVEVLGTDTAVAGHTAA